MSSHLSERRFQLACGVITISLWFLPAVNRDRYHAEWLAELEEMERVGIPSLVPALRILASAPAIGHTLRITKETSLPRQPGISEDLATRVWGRETPFRNPHFTGREAELQFLRAQLTGSPTARGPGAPTLLGQSVQALVGMGGIGKTEIAIEFCHRWAREYDVVWWVRAEQEDTIRNSLIALGRRMELPDFADHEHDYDAHIVLDTLRSGVPYSRWLLIFDNAIRPDIVRRYLPQGHGHVIITSRVSEWRDTQRVGCFEVSQFGLSETVTFLRNRVPTLAPSDDPQLERTRLRDAERLGQTLDNLPLAIEHAAAYLIETGASVDTYLQQYRSNAHTTLSRNVDIEPPRVS